MIEDIVNYNTQLFEAFILRKLPVFFLSVIRKTFYYSSAVYPCNFFQIVLSSVQGLNVLALFFTASLLLSAKPKALPIRKLKFYG